MRVLHLLSNHKWTGPAEPALALCLAERRLGADARFACGRAPRSGEDWVRGEARARGLEPVLPELTLSKHMRIVRDRRDARLVAEHVAAERIDVLHAHLPNDHRIAARAAARLAERVPVRLVRTSYEAEGPAPTRRARAALRSTDALLVISSAAEAAAALRLGFPRDRTWRIEAPVDTARFDPARPLAAGATAADARRSLGLAEDDFVVGIVARMQWHRRFDVLLEAIALARRRLDALPASLALRAVFVGRGTNQEPVAKEPARRLGLGDVVRFPGYVTGDTYVGTVAAFDAEVYLVPGSDGSCRAVREAMALAKPAIVARRGALPEIVEDGRTGLVVDDSTPEGLADAIVRLARDRAAARAMGDRARAEALPRVAPEAIAAAVLRVYEDALARPPRSLRPS